MLHAIYLNIRRNGKLLESASIFVSANSFAEAQAKWAEKVKAHLAAHGCGEIKVPAKVKAGWTAEREPYSFSLTTIQHRK